MDHHGHGRERGPFFPPAYDRLVIGAALRLQPSGRRRQMGLCHRSPHQYFCFCCTAAGGTRRAIIGRVACAAICQPLGRAHAACPRDCTTRFGIELSGDELENGGFAGAVGSYQANLLIMLYVPIQPGEESMRTKHQGDIVETDGDHAFILPEAG